MLGDLKDKVGIKIMSLKQFIIEVFISFGLFAISLLLFASIFDFGNEGNMNGWIETWILSITLTSFGLYLIKDKSGILQKVIKSIIVAGFVIAEVYIIVVQLKIGLEFGAVLLIFVPIIIPLHKILVPKFTEKN